MQKLTAPFQYFGGKSKIADMIWQIFGDVDNFIDPFMGSLAILLARPEWHKGRVETVNDMDAFLSNFWRSVKSDPESVAMYADWPVNEADLVSRHKWLKTDGAKIVAACMEYPDFYDAHVAGWWVWGLCQWIGGGWCKSNFNKLPNLGNAGLGINKLPHLGNAGLGINKLPHLGDSGRGINKLPHLGDAGLGINKLPHLGSAGRGEARTAFILEYMTALQNRLRDVRVCCGDWKRVVTDGAMSHGDNIGVFLDPPYVQDGRDNNIYNHEGSEDLHKEIIAWCKVYEHNPKIKIVLCGYEGSYPGLDWKQIPWKAGRSYGRANINTKNNENRMKERLWISPNCKIQERLF